MAWPEVPFRLWRGVATRLERVGIVGRGPVPARDVSTDGPRWIEVAPDVNRSAYLAEADRILAGEVAAFEDAWQPLGDPPEWNRDPRTGRVAPPAFGLAIDHRDAAVGDPKYLWEVNRQQHLVRLAQAWALTRDRRYLDRVGRDVSSWIEQCPFPTGLNWNSPLEAAIRLISWSVTWQLIGGVSSELFSGEPGQRLRERWLDSVYRHAWFVRHHLSKFSSANNHVLGELAGLYVAATTWPAWPALRAWRGEARRLMLRESLRQTAPDGANREQAVGYHLYALEYMLIAGVAAQAANDAFPAEFWERLRRMVGFLESIGDVAGRVPMFGDSDGGTALRLGPDRCLPPASRYGAWAGLSGAKAVTDEGGWLRRPAGGLAPEAANAFAETGYYVLASSRSAPGEVLVVADAGPLGLAPLAAHGHADALSFTLTVGGREVLIDPGTFDYYSEPGWRDYFRSTRAHNTVVVDGVDQSVAAGAFLWRHQARTRILSWATSAAEDRLEAEHDGYRRLAAPLVHRRGITLAKREPRIRVTDRFAGAGMHRAEWCWHFAEGWTLVVEAGRVTATDGPLVVAMDVPRGLTPSVYRGDATLPAGWRAPAFGRRVPCATLVCRGDVGDGSVFETVFVIQRRD
jgi:hypothetical protein